MMTFDFKAKLLPLLFAMALFSATNTNAQSSCDTKAPEKHAKADCAKDHSIKGESTSGCTPSSCRGAKTKFGEAKVISKLRANLISLKSAMEQSQRPKFDARAYDIHGIVGENDDESLQIIIRELKLMEQEFADKTNFEPLVFSLPENKAKQIPYLGSRIESLKKFL